MHHPFGCDVCAQTAAFVVSVDFTPRVGRSRLSGTGTREKSTIAPSKWTLAHSHLCTIYLVANLLNAKRALRVVALALMNHTCPENTDSRTKGTHSRTGGIDPAPTICFTGLANPQNPVTLVHSRTNEMDSLAYWRSPLPPYWPRQFYGALGTIARFDPVPLVNKPYHIGSTFNADNPNTPIENGIGKSTRPHPTNQHFVLTISINSKS